MASLPKADSNQHFMTAEELLAIRGTPEFAVEYQRQRQLINQAAYQQKEELEWWESIQTYEGWE